MEKEIKIMIFKEAIKIYCACIANPTYNVSYLDQYNKTRLFEQCLKDAQMLAEGSGILE